MFNRYWCLFSKRSSKIKIFIFGILPRDECCSVSRMLIKEINTILKCKCAFHSFNFIEQEQGRTDNNDTLDLSLFYHNKLDLIQKGNIKLSESVITATEDANIDQNTHLNKMSIKKHNQFIKTYKMAVSFKLDHADFPPLFNSTVSEPVSSVSSSLSCTTASRSFSNKVTAISFFSLVLKLVIYLFLGPLAFILETLLLSIYTILPNRLHLILLLTFQLNSNITLFLNLSCRLNPLLLM